MIILKLLMLVNNILLQHTRKIGTINRIQVTPLQKHGVTFANCPGFGVSFNII